MYVTSDILSLSLLLFACVVKSYKKP